MEPSETAPVKYGVSTVASVILTAAVYLAWFAPPRLSGQASGLVAAYSFNEGAGTTLTDLSGNGNTGTIVGAAWTTAGKYGNALSFNGASSYVDIGNGASLQLTGNMTWSAWINAAANLPDDGIIAAKSDATSGWQLKTSRDTGSYTFGSAVTASGGSRVQRYSTTVRSLNTWYYVAGVYNATAQTLDIYVNGVLNDGIMVGTPPGSQVNASVNANIGRRTGGLYFNGVIDEVRIYNRALTQSEIQADMNTPLGAAGTDTQPPTAPSTLTSTAVSTSQLNLSWAASTDDTGVTGYRIERCQGAGCTNFAQIATTSTTSYNDVGLSAGVSYSYRVRATDAAGNLSAYSNVASATTATTSPALVAAFSFNEGTGTTVTDSSGNHNNGTIVNGTWTTSGKYGNALVFNGSNAIVTVPDAASLDLTNAMTLEAWVDPSVVNSAWRDLIYKGNDNYYLEGTSSSGSVPAVGGTFGGANSNVYGTAALSANAWTHLAATYDGMTLRLYVNGTQVSSAARTGSFGASTNPLQIGGDSIYGQYFNGAIDEVRVYNVALTQAQIQSDMNSPIGGTTLQPAVTLRNSTLDFGSQVTGTASAANSLALTNTGGASLAIASITILGVNSSDFSQSNNCGASLAAGSSCAISIVFKPTATGTRTATLTITDNAAGSPHTVGLTGTGTTAAKLSISPRVTDLTFTRTQQFTAMNNNGTVRWLVDGISGGSAGVGTISTTGLYTPPSSAGTHTVTALDQSQSVSATVYVTNYPGTFTRDVNNLRTGLNSNETVLTPANVNSTQFGKLFSYALDGVADASALYIANLSIPGQGYHNVVYVATEHDSVYAFDADGLGNNPLWKVSFINPAAGITSVPPTDTGECCDISPEIGITGSPVIDPATGTLYVIAKTKEVSGSAVNYVHRLHALNIATGAEKFGGPVIIQASVPGDGDGSSGGQVPFLSLRENQRAALLLNNGVVYAAFAAHGDQPPYHGWVLGYNAATLQRVMAYNSSPNGSGGGIWQSGDGLASDSTGNIYFVTGNGDFNANSGGGDYGDSFMKISPGGAVLDYFTPYDQANMAARDIDLGSGGTLLLPDQSGSHPHLAISAGKNGTIYLVDRDNMGKYKANNNSQIVQSLVNVFPNGTFTTGNFKAPVYFNGSLYFSADGDNIKNYTITNGLLSTSPTSRTGLVPGYPGATLSVSANGSTNGILWAVQRIDYDPLGGGGPRAPGVLHAYDATNLGHELYNSNQAAGSRDALDYAAKWSAPLVANGKVFVATNARLTVFSLLP